jgi:chaperone modulatory protein CbpM
MAGARARMSLVLRRQRGGRRTASVETLALEAGLHPDLVLRLVRLGLIEPIAGTQAEPLFASDAAARLARAVRLRRDFGIDYAGAVLASELLARIEQLERRLERYETPDGRRVSGSGRSGTLSGFDAGLPRNSEAEPAEER